MEPRRDDNDRLLGYVAVGSAVMFAAIVGFVVVAQTVLPIFGLEPGHPSDTILGSMVGAVVTLASSVSLRAFFRRRNGNGA